MNYKSCYQAKNKGVKHMDVQAGGSNHNRQIIESDYKSEFYQGHHFQDIILNQKG